MRRLPAGESSSSLRGLLKMSHALTGQAMACWPIGDGAAGCHVEILPAPGRATPPLFLPPVLYDCPLPTPATARWPVDWPSL